MEFAHGQRAAQEARAEEILVHFRALGMTALPPRVYTLIRRVTDEEEQEEEQEVVQCVRRIDEHARKLSSIWERMTNEKA